jgi:hypothetical protein
MKGDLASGVQFLYLVTHVFEQQPVFLQVHLQTAAQQTQQELDTVSWDHALRHTSAWTSLRFSLNFSLSAFFFTFLTHLFS